MKFRLSDRQVGVLFMLPLILAVAIFLVWPIAEAVRLSFVRYNPLRPDDQPFVGLRQLPLRPQRPAVLGELLSGDHLDRLVDGSAGADRRRRWRMLLQQPLQGHERLSRAAAVPLHRADRRHRAQLALAVQCRDRHRQPSPAVGRHRSGEDRLALDAQHGDGERDHAERLEVHALRHHRRAGAAADDPDRALRCREGGWRRRVPAFPRHHTAAACRSAGRGRSCSARSGPSTSSRKSIC